MRVWNDRGVNWRMIVTVSDGPIPGGRDEVLARLQFACGWL